MLGRFSMNDNARVTLANGASTTSAISINPPVAPYNLPADPTGDTASGGVGIATITDSLAQPTKSEIITYTGLSFAAGVYNLTGVTRGAAGSTAQTWDAGAYLFQALNVAGMVHPFFTPNQAANSLTISADTMNFSGTSVAANALTATSATIPAINGTTAKLGAQPAVLPVTSPGFALAGAGVAAANVTMRFTTDALGPNLVLGKARGTTATPAIIANNDVIGTVAAYAARTAAAWTNSCVISFEADGTQTTSSMPSRIVFKTVAANAVSPTEVCRFNADNSVTFAGPVSMGSTATIGSVTVTAGANVGSILNVGTMPTTQPVIGGVMNAAGSAAHMNLTATGANASSAALNLSKGRGNGDTVVANGDEIGTLNWYAYNGASWFNNASISSTVDSAVSGNAVITSIRFQLSSDGTSAPADVMRVMNDGRVLVNGANATINVPLAVAQKTANAPAFIATWSGVRAQIGVDANGTAYFGGSGSMTQINSGGLGVINASAGTGALINPVSSTDAPTAALDVIGNSIRIRSAKTPATSTAAGSAGTICWDANFVYVCVATNSWKRIALSTY